MEHPKEAKRLLAKVNPDDFVRRYLSRLLDNLKGRKSVSILDLGCGCGVISASLAKQYKHFNIYGLDLSAERYHEQNKRNKNLKNLFFVSGNANQIKFEDGKFDLVFSRFLFEYMRDPQLVLKEIVRVTRKQGKVLLQDLDGQLVWHYPVKDQFQIKIDRVLKYFKKNNFDPFVGRKLFFLAKKGGLMKLNVNIEPYHLIAGKVSPKNFKLWDMKLTIALPHIEKALGSKKEAYLFKREYLDYFLDDLTFTYSNLITVDGVKS